MAKVYIWIPESEWAMAPSLSVGARATERKDIFEVFITHPNTRRTLFKKRLRAKSFMEALEKAKQIKEEQLKGIKTRFEEQKFIPRPKRGKMELKRKAK